MSSAVRRPATQHQGGARPGWPDAACAREEALMAFVSLRASAGAQLGGSYLELPGAQD